MLALAIDKTTEIKAVIKSFLDECYYNLEEDGGFALEMCEGRNDFHLSTYWIPDCKNACLEFIKDNYKIFGESLSDVLLDEYCKVAVLSKLESKVKPQFGSGSYRAFLSYEALATLLLKRYQKSKVWYTVYGCTHEDFCDLEGKNHILAAFESPEEFPVMKMSDITAAMLSVNVYIQESSLYDIFAHVADQYQVQDEEQIDLFGQKPKEPVFTPDPFEYEAVVGREKQFRKLHKSKAKGITADLLVYESRLNDSCGKVTNPALKELLWDSTAADIILNEYLYRFAEPPKGLPLNPDSISITMDMEDGLKMFNVRFRIRGILKGENAWREIYNKNHRIPQNADEIQDLIFTLAEEIKVSLAGKEKNDEDEAIGGLFPRKNLASHGLKFKEIPLYLAEHQSLYYIKKAFRYAKIPSVNVSWGADSILTLHLVRRVTKEGFRVLFNNSRNEFAETLLLRDYLTKEWDLDVIESIPDTTIWELQDKLGWSFQRKGARNSDKKGSNPNEICCQRLKHGPSRIAIKMNNLDTGLSGLRADESLNREKAGKRDGVVYSSLTWNQLRINPIIFYTDDMVWEYNHKYNVPYSKIYDMVLYDENGNVTFKPSTGCQACLTAAKYGYLSWLRRFKPRMYWYLMKERGLAKKIVLFGSWY